MLQDMMDVLLLFVKRSGWETANIPCNCKPGATEKKGKISIWLAMQWNYHRSMK